jgi:hypothetical protein
MAITTRNITNLFMLLGLALCLFSCSSRLEEHNPAYKYGLAYKRYDYPPMVFRRKKYMYGQDIELFKGTPAWSLAKAVYEQDTTKIHRLCEKDKSLLHVTEGKFQSTLLSWAVYNYRYFSARSLLLEGANPNDKSSSANTPFIEAAEKEETSNYLSLLLKFGGKVNDLIYDSPVIVTPLQMAAARNLSSTKILVDAGANINFSTDGYNTALSWALIAEKFDIALYLLENGADCEMPVCKSDDSMFYPIDFVEISRSTKGTEEYKQKEKLLKFLLDHKKEEKEK